MHEGRQADTHVHWYTRPSLRAKHSVFSVCYIAEQFFRDIQVRDILWLKSPIRNTFHFKQLVIYFKDL